MSIHNHSERDNKSLIGPVTSPEYIFQLRQTELRECWRDQQDDSEDTEDQAILEELAWCGAIVVDGVLIKKACEHSSCGHYRCDRRLRIGGIEI